MMDHEAELAVQRELDSGESLLWAGSPQKGILFRKSDFITIPFGVFWTGFIIFWERIAIRDGVVPLIIFGIPFAFVGLMLLFGRFLLDAKTRETTYYGVTNKRVVIIKGIFKRKIQSSDIAKLRGLTLIEAKNYKGTISFGAESPYGPYQPFGQTQVPQFEMIDHARDVYDIISNARKA